MGSFFENTAYDGFAVTPGAGALPRVIGGLYVGGAGDVVVTTVAGTSLTFVGAQAGSILPIKATHVTAGTTATNLIGFTEF